MIQLFTPVPIPSFSKPLDYDSSALMLGSCFTEHMGKKLKRAGFHVSINPYGIIFNPVSLSTLIERAMQERFFALGEVESSFCYEAQSAVSGSCEQEVMEAMNHALGMLREDIKGSTHIFITLGTAWVYTLKETGQVVANCHQQPQRLFDKRLLTPDEINTSLHHITTHLHQMNPDIQLIYTLSPVRHLKDGVVSNQRSKARLHEAIQTSIDIGNATYFPAYEIVMDELRDYRYYDRDMLHLNELGIDCVWSRFRESAICPSTDQAQKAIEKHRKLEAHRPKNVELHRQQVDTSREALRQLFPKINI
ncbi:GSCFA domain-containing protein [Nonlabens xiamenensis]|uniref:GSCFA domain-containing protein n=1 Tax=Nonlabens xiamenensis TaxID=2341043 RepID=UPI00197F67D9|nr:GSCFA domain-containing protein [Nonlabens xiamenensis]